MNHKWGSEEAYGVTPNSGTPHGVVVLQFCVKCGCERGRGPQSTHTGKRVIRRWLRDSSGYRVNQLPKCS